jgi:DNA-binding LacI/PurR family transcriptional regulator
MALESYGLEEDISIAAEGDFLVQSGYFAASQLPLNGKDRISAIFAQNDLMAIGAMRFLKAQSLRIPNDVSIVGCDDLDLAYYITPSLTTVAVPAFELGKTAMDLMVDSLDGKNVPSLKILPTELKIRESTTNI